ncbi:sprouty-like protein 2 [Elysia marginata]|uniref:Sprouty-like protein 2 n=1 Tax=Elysia marginata TaxID=1093978 RepID=A0AAV4JRA6_9GAST|nr:sprouty-like protein 2 [Elysia marginata]
MRQEDEDVGDCLETRCSIVHGTLGYITHNDVSSQQKITASGMRTSTPFLSPPDAYRSRQAVSLPQPPPSTHHNTVVVTSLAHLRPGPRCRNDYVDSPRSRSSGPPKTQIHSPSFAAVGGVGGGLSSLNSPRLRQNEGPLTNCSGGLHSTNGQHHHQQLSLQQFASTRPAQGRSLSTSNTTSLSTPGSTVLVVSNQPLSKQPPLKIDACDSAFNGYGRDADGGRLHHVNGRTATTSFHATSTTGAGERLSNEVSGTGVRTTHGSIICKDCGKCRCGACTERQDLPCGTWCCGGKCELTPSKVLDVCTCFCVVKCLFFHCRRGEEEEEDNECYENPCGCCETPLCCQRWTVLGLMSACLPCLWAYWPARACLAASTASYNACCRHKGCQCDLTVTGNVSAATSAGVTSIVSGNSGSSSAVKSSVLSSVRGGGSGGSVIKNSNCSQTRRLLIESDSSSA